MNTKATANDCLLQIVTPWGAKSNYHTLERPTGIMFFTSGNKFTVYFNVGAARFRIETPIDDIGNHCPDATRVKL